MVRDTRVPTNAFCLDICMLSAIQPYRPAIHWSNKVNNIDPWTTHGRHDEASDKEVSVAVHTCMSSAPKIAVVVDNHSLIAIQSDVVDGYISAYLLDNEPFDDEGRVAVYRLLLQGVNIDNLSIRRCTGSRWDPLEQMTSCLVVIVTSVLHVDGVVAAVLLSVVQHNVSHVDVRERMTISKNDCLI